MPTSEMDKLILYFKVFEGPHVNFREKHTTLRAHFTCSHVLLQNSFDFFFCMKISSLEIRVRGTITFGIIIQGIRNHFLVL